MEVFINKGWGLFIQGCFILFPPVSEICFYTLLCEEMEPGVYYLQSDLSIRCTDGAMFSFSTGDSEKHAYWRRFAYVSILAYTIGIPVLFWYILWSNQKRLVLQTPKVVSRFGFLFEKYKDDVWYAAHAASFAAKSSIICIFT
jgi:hypothetical protein